MSEPGRLVIDSAGVGRYTRASTELLDARRVLGFTAGLGEVGDALLGGEEPLVHPGIAFVLQFNAQGFPGVSTASGSAEAWLGAVHAETDLRFHQPFRLGQAITTQGRVVARRQIRSGVYNVERYRMIDDAGALIAEVDFNLIIRGAALGGGDIDLDPLPPRPQQPEATEPEARIALFVPRRALHHYTAGSGIYAPIHTDRRVAVRAGFPDIILHGSATKSIAMSVIIAQCFDGDPTRITRLYGQLRAVVLADTSITVEILAQRQSGDETQVFFRVLNQDGDAAVANGLVIGRTGGRS
ncbi:MAG: hypothetical protein K2Y20_00870 [Sphingomonas sp.]|nr:hypothetical protein [Sphingomonas sp.]